METEGVDRKLPDIRSVTNQEIERLLDTGTGKKYRTAQVEDWLWKKGVTSFAGMTNLPLSTRHLLQEHFLFRTAKAGTEWISSDRTSKTIFHLHDGAVVEGVLIPAGNRFTACISSQAGCALGCAFCATGQLGFTRNLTAGEIFDQIVALSKQAGVREKHENGSAPVPESVVPRSLSNIVFMGMGEPFLNYGNVTKAVEKITSRQGLDISHQRITVSSVGIPKMIRRMADDNQGYHFALSLHAATDAKRDRIIPFNVKQPLAEVVRALQYYHRKTGKRFTIEYILFRNFNDQPGDAGDLAAFCRNFPVKINIIEYNQVASTGFERTPAENVKRFVGILEKKNLVVNVRQSRGTDIEAACGQLAARQGT